MRTTRCLTSLALLGAAGAALAPSAGASTVSLDGGALVLRGAPGERNAVVVAAGDPGRVTISDELLTSFPDGVCTRLGPEYPVDCPLPAAVRLELGDGDDTASFGLVVPEGVPLLVEGGPGADLLKGPRQGIGAATLDGGGGDDELRSEESADTLLGGEGDDTLDGGPGADVLRAGPGDDLLRGDGPAGVFADVIDGGAGSDRLEDYATGDAALAPPVDILLDGVANDGREGEGDDIRGVERFAVGSIRSFTGDEQANTFLAPEKGGAARLDGAGGDDRLFAGDAHRDVVLGGAGDDELSGGFGDDTLTGGPGRDTVAGDRPARCNELHCDITDGFGNDTIDLRDGEADFAQCGPGRDRVLADAADRVADDCETVERSGAAGGGGGTAGGGGAGGAGGGTATAGRLTVARGTIRRAALRRGTARLVVSVSAAGRLRAVARVGATVVANGTRTATRAGRTRLTLRPTPAGRRLLARSGRRRLTVRVSFTPARGGRVLTATTTHRVA